RGDGTRPAVAPVEERALGQAVVRVPVVRRHATFVSPPDVDLAPFGLALRRLGVRLLRCLAACEDDVAPFARRTREPFRDDGRDLLRALDDDELDVAHCSPAASSRDLSMAASIAFRNAARTPACSSSR